MNGSFYVARRPSDASGLSVAEILLTVQGLLPVCGMLGFFQNEVMQPPACSDGK